MIIDEVVFTKDRISSNNIEDCLNLEPRSYMHDVVSAEIAQKVILPGALLEIFDTVFEGPAAEQEKENVIKQLTTIKIEVNYRDIYDNRFTVERKLDWFSSMSDFIQIKSGI